MSNKLIDLNALSEYKTKSDLKYQDKLTAGDGIGITSGTISVSGLLKTHPFTVSSSNNDQSITVPYSSDSYVLFGLTVLNNNSYINLLCFRNDYITSLYFQDTTVHFVRKSATYWANNSATLYFLKI